MTPSRLDTAALAELLRLQDGLISVDQATTCGLTPSSLTRRVQSATSGWRRVLPRVYVHGEHDLTVRQKTRAAVLYTGPGAVLTGGAALRWHGLRHLPAEVDVEYVDVVVPVARQVTSRDWARVRRSGRPSSAYSVDALRCMPVTRAVVDAAGRLPYEVLLALLCTVINQGRTSPAQLLDELSTAPVKGSAGLRKALSEVDRGIRSIPEAHARRLFAAAGLPEPLVNQSLIVGGRLFVPDFRWGRVILEVDSKAHHLLEGGSWDRTQARRMFLQAHGYIVIPVTPEQLRETPEEVIASIVSALQVVSAA
jgi:hypothetical protein